MKYALGGLALLLMGELALASISSTVVNGNGNSGVSSSATTKLKPGKRSLSALYMRDPEYEHAMNVIGKATVPPIRAVETC
jgi:hypothetical protein